MKYAASCGATQHDDAIYSLIVTPGKMSETLAFAAQQCECPSDQNADLGRDRPTVAPSLVTSTKPTYRAPLGDLAFKALDAAFGE